LLIYEAHVGMAQETEGVGTYKEFTEKILPRIKADGYNAVQLMAIAEHPYYGSFGYHVSNFFAPSSRFGTPEELKELIDTAHGMGLLVIMDLVHSHTVKNIREGLNLFDGSDHQYLHPGARGEHRLWDSKLFDYGKENTLQLLLSNVRYWLEDFHFDGFRFDGVTSMLYLDHGIGVVFDAPEKYFGSNVDDDAVTYLQLANTLTHELNPDAITIAEDVSGMPGLCQAIADGGMGFDYRLGMGLPDFWIKVLKDQPEEQWNMSQFFFTMNDHLPTTKTIAYAESHDQALVGDKTIAFRLMDKEMYTSMSIDTPSITVDRGIALHKMIRLFTITLGGEAWLNFMGNEFGHPEWIDFPRHDNGWSYQYARRQWSLVDNGWLKYKFMGTFDQAMLNFVKDNDILSSAQAWLLKADEENKTIIYERNNLIFVFNWGAKSLPDYEIPLKQTGDYRIIFSSDSPDFGGFGNISTDTRFPSEQRTDG
ncbi:MAG: alpha amylase C-terminal domain-containing protein, partial [Bacteroidales bacterium]|nr:alpha amylase C-terminal domain-containing protein [Bacteroidales bacterium]